MRRVESKPRENWEASVESQGFVFHTADDQPYWDESAYYAFPSGQIDALEAATAELNDMCLAAVEHILADPVLDCFQIPPEFIRFVRESWQRDEHTIYGRFDLAYDGRNPPKLLEYNADTPTALLEAAVIQWQWFKDTHPNLDQFNSIHERLIEAWKSLPPDMPRTIYFSSLGDHVEDVMTVNYLRDTAMQAGLTTEFIPVEQIGWNASRRAFLDLAEREMDCVFKLYPWEWLIREEFGPYLLESRTRWLEAPWKMILSNKAILPVLRELYPSSPYLLDASFEPLTGDYVQKPLLAREGANVTIFESDRFVLATDGDYEGPYVYQRLAPPAVFDGRYPIVGSWMVNGYACGMGIREDVSRVTGNTSRFVPHVISD